MQIEKIDYIIKTHNELPYLRMMLATLKWRNTCVFEKFNIKVYGNRCTDGTKEWCEANGIDYEDVDLPGLYSIWNYGMSKTSYEWVIFSASDFVFAHHFWCNIIKKVEAEANLYGELKHFHWTGTCIDNGISYPHEDEPNRRWYKRNCGDNWKDFDLIGFDGCAQNISSPGITDKETQYCPFITTREHYNTLGGFDTSRGDYPADIDNDFVWKGKGIGRESCIVNDAVFWHFGKKSLLRRDGTELTYDWKTLGGINDFTKS